MVLALALAASGFAAQVNCVPKGWRGTANLSASLLGSENESARSAQLTGANAAVASTVGVAVATAKQVLMRAATSFGLASMASPHVPSTAPALATEGFKPSTGTTEVSTGSADKDQRTPPRSGAWQIVTSAATSVQDKV
eukprot:gnl/TRDRNA2_/TRDRNA2_42377_c1_seq1.p1 gnl/TRDRNA2_/TRDRNA2_42377_c1~~gnl/TRDRNA2_/TRDRNA2_42377_c1_seq1.p1  ORF type:complete len:150 (+),score=25.29 gnl/TRDRNA2_/TRDRNA2_42377_c1_seq1:36-452(+)